MKNTVLQQLSSDDIRDRESTLSKTFTALKWFLAISVVADHFLRAEVVSVLGVHYDASTYPGFGFISDFIHSFVKNYAVPVFFFMSGYLCHTGSRFSMADYSSRLGHKLGRLMKLYVIWTIFGLAFYFLYALPGHLYGDAGLMNMLAEYYSDGSVRFAAFFRDFFGIVDYLPTFNVPLWYMRDLMLMLLAIPLLQAVASAIGWKPLTALTGLAFLWFFNDNILVRPEVALFFFTTGYMMRCNDIAFMPIFRRIFPFALVLYPLLGTTHFCLHDSAPEIARIAKNVNICLAVPMTVCGMYLLVGRGVVKASPFLASSSFFLYVTHVPLLKLYHLAVMRLFEPADGSAWGTVDMITAFVAVIVVSTAIYALIERHATRLAGFLTGTRIAPRRQTETAPV